jgi:hypothetical protein
MKDFQFKPLDAQRIIESLHLVTGVEIPYVRVYNLRDIVVPRAMKYFPTFKRIIFREPAPTNSDLLTIDDFKTFEIVKTPSNQLLVGTAESGEMIGLKMDTYRYGTVYNLGKWGIFMRASLDKVYRDLVSMLPIPIAEITKTEPENFYTPSLTLSTFSAASLSFLYFLYTFDARQVNHKYKVKVFAVRGTTADAIDKLKKMSERLRELGDDFPTMLNNLLAFSCILR